MPVCKKCGDEVEELVAATLDGKKLRVCEQCADLAREQSEIAAASESVMQQMMGFKGRR